MKKKILILICVIFIGIQLYNPNSNNSSSSAFEDDFINLYTPKKELENILRNTCYDCHSNQTNYPWYSYIAPISYFIYNHVQNGKKHLNLSEWGKYPEKEKINKINEIITEIEQEKMPLKSYTWMHAESDLVSIEKESLQKWLGRIQILLAAQEKIRNLEEKP